MEVNPKVENKVHTLAKKKKKQDNYVQKKQDNYVTTQLLCSNGI